jgi:4-amino-4-deoxy-L-arabinose transferase-like glycosyltransferase
MQASRSSLLEDLGRQRLLAGIVAIGILLSFFLGLGAVPLFDLDEGAFSEATREMLLRGDYISTFLNGQPRYDKPILIYWLQAVSVLTFGTTEFAFRLPSALCATAWVVLVFLFVRRVRDTRTGLLAAGFTATAAGITVIGRAAIADALLNLLLVAACTSAYLYFTERDRRWLRATFVAVGFGLLAKGPVAVLVPAAATFLFCLSRGDLRAWFRALLDPAGIALMLAIAAPWYIAQYAREGDAFVRGFLLKHNVDRFSAPMHGFRGSVFFYLPWLFVATLPFLAPLLRVLRDLPALWRDDLGRFCLLWFGFVLAFFSLSGTKLPHYAFYGYTGVFIAMALRAGALRSALLAMLPPALLFASLLALPSLLERWVAGVPDAYYREAFADLRQHFGTGWYLAAGTLAGACVVLMRRRFALPIGERLLLAGCGTAALLAVFILPIVGAAQQQPVKEAALLARERGYKVVMWGLDTPSFIVYSGSLVEKRDPRAGEIALAKVKRLGQLPAYETLYRRNGIALVRVLEGPP